MKKLIAFALALTISASTIYAADYNPDVPAKIVSKLNKDFAVAGDVTWKITNEWYKAIFTADNEQLEVFYDTDGNFLGVSRNLTVEDLPLALKKDVVNKMKSYKVTEVFEMLTNRGTEYYITYAKDGKEESYRGGQFGWQSL